MDDLNEDKKCKCGCGIDVEEDCICETDCHCGENEHECHCSGDCDCGDDCKCTKEDKCNPDCTCGEECHCSDGCECGDNCSCGDDCKCEEKQDYLKDLLRVQAEFDNYRKRMVSALGDARQDGFMDAIEKFLPALDSFKMATEYIQDKNTLMGIKFIEKGILDTLSKMGVECIDTSGEFNPELHQAVDVDKTADVAENMVVKEIAKGFIYKGKVIRYSQVIVRK